MPDSEPLQLVLHGKATTPDFELVPNPVAARPSQFEDANHWVPRLGSKSLVDLAVASVDAGARVTRVEMLDRRANPVQSDEAAQVSYSILEAIRSDQPSRAHRLLEENSFSVGEVEIAINNRRATVARDGIVTTSRPEDLLTLLKRIWSKARLA